MDPFNNVNCFLAFYLTLTLFPFGIALIHKALEIPSQMARLLTRRTPRAATWSSRATRRSDTVTDAAQ